MKIFTSLFLIFVIHSSSVFSDPWYSKNPDDLLDLKFPVSSANNSSQSSNLNVLSLKIFQANTSNDKIVIDYGYNNLIANRQAKITWTASNIKIPTRTYYVMVRYDPRFKNQVFIVDLDVDSNEQKSRYEYLNSVSEALAFFGKKENTTIEVKKNSVVSIKQIPKEVFFGNSGGFREQNYLDQNDKKYDIQTISFGSTDEKDNKLVYYSFLNIPKDGVITDKLNNPTSAYIKDGIRVLVNGKVKKDFGQDFLNIGSGDNDYVATFESGSDGLLSFELNESFAKLSGKSLAAGRYFFLVEVGGEDFLSQDDVVDLYYVVDRKVKNSQLIPCKKVIDTKNKSGTNICEQIITPEVGNIYFMAKTKDKYKNIYVSGALNTTILVDDDKVSISESIWNLINNKIIKEYEEKSKMMFSQIAATISPIAKTLLVIYIIIYGMYFSLGGIKVTVMDLFNRVVKVILVVVLIDQTQNWQFYNEYIFEFFKGGINYIFSYIIGGESLRKNPFTFIDVFLETFLSFQFWLNMLVLFIRGFINGTIFVFILVFAAVWQFIKSMFVIVGEFFVCYLVMYVLISVFPVLLIFVLFGLTKSMFENYLNFLAKYMLKPAILLLFFLIVSDLMNLHIKYFIKDIIVTPLINFGLYFDLDNIGIPDASVDIDKNPLLPYIPFFDILSPENFYLVRHGCAIYCIGLCVSKLNDYAKSIFR
jgi:type IV secretory pathway VirB2 component (pilin)